MDGFVGALPRDAGHSATLRVAQLARLLRRHLWLIGSLAILCAGGAYLYSRTLPRTYNASVSITVEGERFAIPELQGALRNDAAPDPMPWVRTEVQALTSHSLVSQVAGELALDKVPEFNPALRPPTLMQRAKDVFGELVLPVLPHGPDGAPKPGPDDEVVGSVTHALTVFQDNRSLVIAVSFTSEDPHLAAQVVNKLIDDYIAGRAKRRSDANQGANKALLERIDQVRNDVAGIEKQMRDLRNKAELVTVRAGGVGNQQLEELTTAAARATLERSQLEVQYDRATSAAKQGSSDVLATVLNSPTISHLRDQEATANGQVAELATRYGSSYPGVRSAGAQQATIRKQIADEAGRIVASIGAQLRVARAQETDVQKQLTDARRVAVVSENSRAQLEQMQQEATSRRALYQTLLERAQQTVAQPAVAETPDVRILSAAVPPGAPSGPNSKLASLMGGAGGGLLGCLIALARIHAVERVETSDEVAKTTGLPVLGSLPAGTLRRGRGVLATNVTTVGLDAAALREMRARLMMAGRSGAPRVVVFVPAEAGEVAAEVALGMARVAAAGGDRVLLIEGDLRAQKLGRAVGQLVGVMPAAGSDDWRDMVVADRQPGLDLLLAPGRNTAAHGVAAGPHFQNLLVEARADYDLVLMDSPPATTAEMLPLVQRSDVAVLVIPSRLGNAAVQEAASQLRAASRTPAVAVLSGAT